MPKVMSTSVEASWDPRKIYPSWVFEPVSPEVREASNQKVKKMLEETLARISARTAKPDTTTEQWERKCWEILL